jgi:hypothetical protein
MKNKINIYMIAILSMVIIATSCEKMFLEKPTGSDLTVDSIFATKLTSLGPIAESYSKALAVGFPFYKWILFSRPDNKDVTDPGGKYGLLHGTIANIADESYYNQTFAYDYKIITGGMRADDGSGDPLTEDAYKWHWQAIRICYVTLENIDLVANMTATEKDQVKAEMKTLIAYRYVEMLKRYGGIPIVKKSLSVADDIKIPRSSVEDVVNFIAQLCDEAVTVLPDSYADDMKGRVTKGVALSVKAEAFMFAARPLFNSDSPYLSLGGDNDKFICYGNYDAARWEKAIQANLAVLSWAATNGYHLINTGNPMVDFGVATSVPGNAEIILAYKFQYSTAPGGKWNTGLYAWFNPHEDYGRNVSVSYRMLQQFYKADGTDQTWVADRDTLLFSDYSTKCDQMEPRFMASVCKVAGDAQNNPNDLNWKYKAFNTVLGEEGCGAKIKFWANAGSRNWFEFPIYRLAENYLNLAEAYNEAGNPTKALEYLKFVRDRAGIPNATQTDKDLLRKTIQREWAVEFFEESHRLYDIKHWKIAAEILGAPRDRFVYSFVNAAGPNDVETDFKKYWKASYAKGFWSPSQYLVPFPAKEINKGYLVQNPGY